MSDEVQGMALLREIVEETASPNEAAITYLLRIGVKSREQVRLLVPIVELAARIEFRTDVRVIERGVFRPRGGSARRTLSEAIDNVADRKRLLEEGFALGDGRFVLWGDATIADHETRIAMLEAKRNGISDTIDRHRGAIAKCREHGVECLRDLDAVLA